jgi:hypothetical protein|tara:strand:- start:3964 stop:4278 length:315 start_codon:yes stop_codon:yes gene_type:complete
MSKTESITLPTGLQVNRTRRNGVTIITTGVIRKKIIQKYIVKILTGMLFLLVIAGSFVVTIGLLILFSKKGTVGLISISPMILFIGFLQFFLISLFIQHVQDEK